MRGRHPNTPDRTRGRGAHPRGCGADSSRVVPVWLCRGSSPRVRGRLAVVGGEFAGEGLIPAGAGQTATTVRSTVGGWAHPRGCGADQPENGVPGSAAGSSPRVRGRRTHAVNAVHHTGLIPAGAGQTTRLRTRRTRDGAHPRGCGADGRFRPGGHGVRGSSPRVRGRHLSALVVYLFDRLIPAGAGQTFDCGLCGTSVGAHPRGCGADGLSVMWWMERWGSSPRVRGRPPAVVV